MKAKGYHIILISLLGLVACKKERLTSSQQEASFLKVMNLNDNYGARDVIELPDGSVLFTGVALFDNQSLFFTPSTQQPSIMAKYTANGILQWQIELPEAVQLMWHCILLTNGNIVVVGFNSEVDSEKAGIVIINQEGEVIKQTSFINELGLAGPALGSYNCVDVVELPNGNLALALVASFQTSSNYARLVIYDQFLGKVFDNRYDPDSIVAVRSLGQVSIQVDAAGDILIHGRDAQPGTNAEQYFAQTLKINGGSYTAAYQQLFSNPTTATPSTFAQTNQGSIVWAAANASVEDTLFTKWFNMRNQDVYSVGSIISVWKTDGIEANTVKATFSGYPKYGYAAKVIKCSQGGYMLYGTCNINSNQLVPSEYQLMLVKISESLQVESMQFPKTSNPSVSGDIKETATGYLLSATHLSMGEQSRPILFKTDKNGIIN